MLRKLFIWDCSRVWRCNLVRHLYKMNMLQQSGRIDLLHKSHNVTVPYPTMHNFVAEMCTFLLQNDALWIFVLCIVGFVKWVYYAYCSCFIMLYRIFLWLDTTRSSHGGVSYCVLRCELTTSVDFPYFSCCKMDPIQTHDSDSRRKQPRKRYLVQFLQQTNAAKVRLVM